MKCYAEAAELDPTDPVYLSNTASVYMAQQDYIKALEVCDKALEVARENNAGFEAIGKVKICEILVFLSSLKFGPSSLSLSLS